jgi:hypothetical protein
MLISFIMGAFIAIICCLIYVQELKKQAINANVAEYIINPKTGDVTFIYTNKWNKYEPFTRNGACIQPFMGLCSGKLYDFKGK